MPRPENATLLKHLQALVGERNPFTTPGPLEQAGGYIAHQFQSMGLAVSREEVPFEGITSHNIFGLQEGTNPSAGTFILGAHYDSVQGSPGADDNASAVAVMLELARRTTAKPPGVPLRFVAFAPEEPPAHATRHQGSRVFVKRLTEAGGRVAGAIILEMVGLTTPKQRYPLFLQWAGYPDAGNFIAVVGNRASKPLGERVLRGMRKNPALPVESLFVWFNGWILADTRLSDHAPFWDKGFPALMITDTAYFRNPNYHGPNDTADTLDYAFMAELVRSLEHAFDAL